MNHPPPPPRTYIASWYNAPQRASMASRRLAWRGRTFIVTYGHRSARVTCRGWGPARWTGREIDLSRDVAERLGWVGKGVVRVGVRGIR